MNRLRFGGQFLPVLLHSIVYIDDYPTEICNPYIE